MNYKHGETGLSYDWLLNNDGFIQRLCTTTTANGKSSGKIKCTLYFISKQTDKWSKPFFIFTELDKLVPCANSKGVRDNIIRSIADIKNIPKPTDDLTLKEAQKGVCKYVTLPASCLLFSFLIFERNISKKKNIYIYRVFSPLLLNKTDCDL